MFSPAIKLVFRNNMVAMMVMVTRSRGWGYVDNLQELSKLLWAAGFDFCVRQHGNCRTCGQAC